MQLWLCAKCIKVTQIMDHLSSFQSSNHLICSKRWDFFTLEKFEEVHGKGKFQGSAVIKRQATPLPFWPTLVTLQLLLIWQETPLLPQESICERQNTPQTWTRHPEFPTSTLITIQCLISGLVRENRGLDLDVAFTQDETHDSNPEALVYCTVGGYLFTVFYNWNRIPRPRTQQTCSSTAS